MREFNETHEIRKVQLPSYGQMAFPDDGGDCVMSPDGDIGSDTLFHPLKSKMISQLFSCCDHLELYKCAKGPFTYVFSKQKAPGLITAHSTLDKDEKQLLRNGQSILYVQIITNTAHTEEKYPLSVEL